MYSLEDVIKKEGGIVRGEGGGLCPGGGVCPGGFRSGGGNCPGGGMSGYRGGGGGRGMRVARVIVSVPS